MQGNLHKSDEGWSRFQERTEQGARARRAHMDHRPRTASKRVAPKPIVKGSREEAELSAGRFAGRRRVVIDSRS